jgi:hypothetical protein
MAAEDNSRAQITTQETFDYCVLRERQKILCIMIASIVTFLSPVSGNIYYPAVGSLSRDFHVPESTINWTITVYMVRQFDVLKSLDFAAAYLRVPHRPVCSRFYAPSNRPRLRLLWTSTGSPFLFNHIYWGKHWVGCADESGWTVHSAVPSKRR